jgi:ATP-dependent Clp protease ATP-binding subunit ClpA
MNQFITASDSAFRDLETRASGKCLRFRQQQMPAGCAPAQADVGFEIDPESGVACLHVQKGIEYSGSSEAVAAWFQAGSKAFLTFDSLVEWIRGPLQQAYSTATATSGTAKTVEPTPRELTDMAAVRRKLQSIERPEPIDEADLARRLRDKVLGQDFAMNTLAGVVARHFARIEPKRPAVLFAVGPSGVGKTRAAETLAHELQQLQRGSTGFGFLRLDMTEYQEAHRVSQLIGSPQGYVGHGEGSQLVDTLRANPRTIVLFDEIEKAHAAILRVLMNAMDAGRLSTAERSSSGHQIDCREAVFIFTSNLDAQGILDELENRDGFGDRTKEDEICRKRIRAGGVPPEIVGRIGRFLVFQPLSPETRAAIIALTIAEVAREYGVQISYVEPSVIVHLLERTQAQGFGARPAQFLIDELLGALFAEAARTGCQSAYRVLGPPFRCSPVSQPSSSKPCPTAKATPQVDPATLIFPQNPSLN